MNKLSVAIIGHTNTGKTSLIRNLARERNFGEVRDEASTTIDVSQFSLTSNKLTFEFIDTPGIEDAMGILEILEQQYPLTNKVEESTRLQNFMEDPQMQTDFEQEIKVLKQLFLSDLAIYVIDARLPYLPKFDHELALILQAHKPILPIFNFLAQGQHLNDWKTHLKAHGIHHFLEYDTIIPPQKRRLYEQIAIMFPEYYDRIQDFIEHEEKQQKAQFTQAMKILANFYLNCLTYQVDFKVETDPTIIIENLQENIIKSEKSTINALLTLYNFNDEDIHYLALSVNQTKFDDDFFTSDNLIDFSKHFGKGATVGAGVFVGLDALSGFTTLGAATATGAILGGLTNTLKHYGGKIWNSFNKIETFCINDDALINLTTRMIALIGLLNGRSHAEIKPILLQDNHIEANDVSLTILDTLLDKTRGLRAYPEYCDIYQTNPSPAREKSILKIQSFFLKHITALRSATKSAPSLEPER